MHALDREAPERGAGERVVSDGLGDLTIPALLVIVAVCAILFVAALPRPAEVPAPAGGRPAWALP